MRRVVLNLLAPFIAQRVTLVPRVPLLFREHDGALFLHDLQRRVYLPVAHTGALGDFALGQRLPSILERFADQGDLFLTPQVDAGLRLCRLWSC